MAPTAIISFYNYPIHNAHFQHPHDNREALYIYIKKSKHKVSLNTQTRNTHCGRNFLIIIYMLNKFLKLQDHTYFIDINTV